MVASSPGAVHKLRGRRLEREEKMRITDVKTFLVYVPERGRNFTFVKIYTDEGLTGLARRA